MRSLTFITALLAGCLAAAGEAVWFVQDFENPQFFTSERIENGSAPGAGSWKGLFMPHTQIVAAEAGRSGNALRITRIGSHRAFDFRGEGAIPAGRNYKTGFDARLEGGDKSYCLLLDAAGNRIAGFSLAANGELKLSDEQGLWGGCGLQLPSGWFRVEAEFDVIRGEYTPAIRNADGTVTKGTPAPMLASGVPAVIQFGTELPEGTSGVIDNISLSYEQTPSLSGRTDAAATATRSFSNGVTTVEFASPAELSTARISGVSAPLSARGLNIMGQWQQLFEELAPDCDGTIQTDFPAAKLVRIELSGAAPSGKIEFFTVPGINQRAADRDFQARVYGEFFLPVYSGASRADLHIFNTAGQPIAVTVDLTERTGNRSAAPQIERELLPGENVIEFETAGLEPGEYVAEIREKNGSRGSLRRLLRLQRLEEPEPTGVPDLRGQKLFFPDDYYFATCENLNFKAAVATQHRVTRPYTTPGQIMQHGDGLYLADGKLCVPFSTLDNFFTLATRRNYLATASPASPDQWEYREQLANEVIPRSGNALNQTVAAGDWLPKPGPDGKITYRLYDPERDGEVDVRQVEIKYVTFMPAGTLGGEALPEWGEIRPAQRSTWALWHKAPGESLVLGSEPLLTDGNSAGEFEGSRDSNDNFAGQWLSDDGKTLYYVRGRILRRYPPYNVPYDNGSNIVRILHVFRTTDGIHFDRAAMALPDHDDTPGTQHYGASIFRVKDGAGLRAAFVARYFARDQRIGLEIAFSRDGFNWKRFPGQPILADNGPRGSWNAGYIGGSAYSVNTGGKTFALTGWNASAYHFNSELIWNRKDMSTVTGSMVRKYMENREIDKWPLLKNFRDWDDLAAYIRNSTIDVGLLEFREDGLFYTEAGTRPGGFTTIPVRGAGSLRINAETAPDGYVEVELLSGERSLGIKRVSGDLFDQTLFTGVPDGEYRIRAEMVNSRLYTLGFFPE